MEGSGHLPAEHAEGVAGHPEMGEHQHQHQGGACPALDQQVAGQGPVAAMGLQQPAVHAEQDPDARRHQDEGDAPAVGAVTSWWAIQPRASTTTTTSTARAARVAR